MFDLHLAFARDMSDCVQLFFCSIHCSGEKTMGTFQHCTAKAIITVSYRHGFC